MEIPGGDNFAQLVRLRPEVGERRQILVADGKELIADRFPLLPTLDHPHWTVQMSEPTEGQFGRVRSHFRGPVPNPAFGL